ncbi:metallophosphoesterase [Pseudonocardia kunmingensis]|uniref:Calcineurin-like phosphoesterase family protein n=1 Tax=Pseudonocardia kunmingensis TaxID=630975 RepID=A0A543DR58_9PSEU|nr:metallophosphoesterase [Pseudonocardia kunmingensis]TQM11808.1 calcineurin-like phosphoesterase family protein [Pseudonocardia kunmingensis]
MTARFLAVVSDSHLTADPASADALRAALAVVEAGARPDALLLPGDLAADGEPGAYRLLREVVDPVAARLGIPVVPVMGNHDERGAFRAALGAGGEPGDPWDTATRVGGLRIAVLDSTVPGHHHGALDPDQLERLRAELAEPAPEGTVLLLHHPPLPSPVPSVDLLRLRGTEKLAEVLAGTDVRIIVCGHAHYAGAGALAGIPVWIAPALIYRVDALPPAGRLRGVAGPAISRVDLVEGTAVATAILLGGEPVNDVDAAERVAWMRERIPAP